ncbi:unnamed protein product [Rotaria sp. Silwood1]|nr:unnamed protein product [Rotaria sp. Silwood1]CAF1365477.1 unnamed protein product [Rotaria sp. Silwood1]CAF3562596.1 unnamed protein product [Rotaria sp. Silwood1]CAF3629810.1 unnamed protein product [Rotaria sp. Silwood1]CAF4775263.1 unnamed protein product [Rotaria sp. Silwood1]
MHKAKIFYFTVFTLVVFAFIFHATAMGHHHWKKATANIPVPGRFIETTIGLFTRCIPSETNQTETCFPNKYPMSDNCYNWTACLPRNPNEACQCDFLPSTKGIAACTIIAAVFLGLSIIILFIHSINTSETYSIGVCLSFFPLILLLLAFIFILIALILVGSYLSRDIMQTFRTPNNVNNLDDLRNLAANAYEIRIDWSTGLEIIALILTFFSLILYALFVFKIGRSS